MQWFLEMIPCVWGMSEQNIIKRVRFQLTFILICWLNAFWGAQNGVNSELEVQRNDVQK